MCGGNYVRRAAGQVRIEKRETIILANEEAINKAKSGQAS